MTAFTTKDFGASTADVRTMKKNKEKEERMIKLLERIANSLDKIANPIYVQSPPSPTGYQPQITKCPRCGGSLLGGPHYC